MHAPTKPPRPPEDPVRTGGPHSPGCPECLRRGDRLRTIQLVTPLDAAAFAAALGITEAELQAMQAGQAPLPAALLPRLANLLDAPLETVAAEITAADSYRAGELQVLAEAYSAIRNPAHREALLAMACALSAEG